MAIELKKSLSSSSLSPAQQKEILALDENQDGRLLTESLKGPYAGEFRGMTAGESREFLYRVETFLRVRSEADSENSIFLRSGEIAEQLLVQENSYWNSHARPAGAQADFAEESFHEIHTPRHVAALEKKYGIDIRRNGGELSANQAGILDRSLATLQSKAPRDFSKLSTLTLHFHAERGGGLTHLEGQSQIDLYGPFAPASASASMASSYAEDMPGYFNADAETYLTQVLAHELGHLTESKAAMEFYRKTFPGVHDRVLEERYAEDYRTSLFSADQEVALRGADGRLIGHAAERRDFHRQRN